jgi:hypothetical protein
VVVSDRTVCSRLANEGKFLLDTVFQSATTNLNGISSSNHHNHHNHHHAMYSLMPPPPLLPASSSSSSYPYLTYNDNNYHSSSSRTLELTFNDATTLVHALRSLETTSQSAHSESLSVQPLIEQIDAQLKHFSGSRKASDTKSGGQFNNAFLVVDNECNSSGDECAGSSSSSNSNNSGGGVHCVGMNSWTTVLLTECYHYMSQTFQQCIDELKRTNLQSPAIPIISLLLDRLYRLDATLIDSHLLSAQLSNSNGGASGNNNNAAFGNNYDKRFMCSEVI